MSDQQKLHTIQKLLAHLLHKRFGQSPTIDLSKHPFYFDEIDMVMTVIRELQEEDCQRQAHPHAPLNRRHQEEWLKSDPDLEEFAILIAEEEQVGDE
jgi:hypothetical protein